MSFDFPKDPVLNVRWRIRCRDKAIVDPGFRDAFWQACMDDPIFFFNSALWVFEPRAKLKVKPFCIAAGTLVVTNYGPVPIEDITRQDLLWDGETWVSHDGALCMGRKPVIMAYGLGITSDHKVWTKNGWQKACEGHERAGVRLPDGYRQRFGIAGWQRTSGEVALSVRVRNDMLCRWSAPAEGKDQELRMPEDGGEARAHEKQNCDANVLHVVRDATAVLEPEQPHVASVRRPWDHGLQTVGIVRELSVGHGRKAEGRHAGEDQQRRQLRAYQLPVGRLEGAGEEQEASNVSKLRDTVRAVDGQGNCGEDWPEGRDDLRATAQGDGRAGTGASTAIVYDILNCGPRNAFTVIGDDGQPLLVHNCTWGHQDPVILQMDRTIDEAMENELPISMTIPKSRAQGGTYIYLGVMLRRALKDPGFSAGLVTRNEELVDSRTDADAVMFKLAWMIDRLPQWMVPDGYQRNSTEHTIALPNGSVFSGYAATGDVARGGRKTVFAFDEPGSEEFVQGNKDYKVMSSVAHVSNCTFLVSTFGLDSGVFYESAMDPDNKRVAKLDWRDNPEHSKLAYTMKHGEATAVRPEETNAVREYIKSHGRELKSIERRGHKMDGKVRSPWYDAHCLLPGGTPRFIARELDMDPRGAVGKLFDSHMLDTVKSRDCRPPVWQGKPVFDAETLKLTGLLSQKDGPLKLWFKPGLKDNSAPLGPYSIGCDIAMGSDGAYSSNSVASVIDDRTGEQVAEYTIMGMQSILFARNVIGLCRWLRNARLGWEDSGVSGPFAKEVMETVCYGNVYYREVAEIGSRRKTRKAGWRNGKDDDKADLFEKLALAMETGKFRVRSEDLIRECGEYEWEKGKIVHRPTKNIDQSEKAHGDRCIAAGVAWLVYSEYTSTDRIDTGEETGQTPEVGSFLWREQQERKRASKGSPDYSIRDVLLT